MTRRSMLVGALGVAAMTQVGKSEAGPAEHFEVEKSEAEWRKQLSPSQYHVLREHGTERAGSSPLVGEHRKGAFKSAGAGLPLFASPPKSQPSPGWPHSLTPLPV